MNDGFDMRWRELAEGAFVVFVLGAGLYLTHRTKTSPQEVAAPTPSVAGFANFCGRAHLVPKALDDCRKAMAAATTDADRIRVEHRFAMGNVELDEPSPP